MFTLPPTPKKNWAVDLLTTDYLISGFVDGDSAAHDFDLNTNFQSLLVISARLQPTGNYAVPEVLTAPWTTIKKDTLVAMIPRDPQSVATAQQRNKGWTHPLPAEVYVGHYVIRGTVLSPFTDVVSFATLADGIVQQAQISSLLPGAQLTNYSAPYVVLRGPHIHFVRPLA